MKYINVYAFFKKLPKETKEHLRIKFYIEVMFYVFIFFGYFILGSIGYYCHISPLIISIFWVTFFIVLTVLKILINLRYL